MTNEKKILSIIQKHLQGQALLYQAVAELMEFDKQSDYAISHSDAEASGRLSASSFVDDMMERLEKQNNSLLETKIEEES